MSKTCVVIGAGPGLGAAVARRFAREQFSVALVARNDATVAPLAKELGPAARTYAADTTDAKAVATAAAAIQSDLPPVEVVVYNAGAFQIGGVLELSVDDFEQCWRANCLGGFLWARELVGAMVERGRGTVIFTGATASLRGSARFSGLAVGKFGLRALAQSMARELGPRGVHVAHVVIDGQIESARTRQAGRAAETVLSPAAIADSYWHLHGQDATAWTHELDLRPAIEKW